MRPQPRAPQALGRHHPQPGGGGPGQGAFARPQGDEEGRPAAALAYLGAFRACAVDAGDHAIDWVYRPPLFYGGLLISLAALLICAAVAYRAAACYP